MRRRRGSTMIDEKLLRLYLEAVVGNLLSRLLLACKCRAMIYVVGAVKDDDEV